MVIETARCGNVGETVELRFRLAQGRARGETIVARCEIVCANSRPPGGRGTGPFGVGLCFVELDDRTRRAIKSCVLTGLLEQSI